jgi:hypothetical protein
VDDVHLGFIAPPAIIRFASRVINSGKMVIEAVGYEKLAGEVLGTGVVVLRVSSKTPDDLFLDKMGQIVDKLDQVITQEIDFNDFQQALQRILNLLNTPRFDSPIDIQYTMPNMIQEMVTRSDSEPAVADDALFLGKMKINVTESGYANVQLGRPLDVEYVKQFFKGMDVYAEANQASVIVKKNANIFLYAEPNDTQLIAFGPVTDLELLVLVFKYIRTTMTRDTFGA